VLAHLRRRHRPTLIRGLLIGSAMGAISLPWAPEVGAAMPQSEARGRIHLVWDAEPTQDNPDGLRAFLHGDDGSVTDLVLDAAGGQPSELLSWDRRRVDAIIDPLPPDGAPGTRARLLGVRPLEIGPALAPARAGVSGLDFITVLCRFADDPSVPLAPERLAQVVGSEYPGMAEYYAELAWAPGIMAGNGVTTAWYDLPQVRSYYVQGTSLALADLATDCTRAAEAEIDFRDYYGINLQFGGALATRASSPYDVLSFGGSWTSTLNGQTRTWGMTWISIGHAENYVIYAHEMGHALGWPHSSGRYGNAYDSNWDVMSRGYLRNETPWGWLTVHTIAAHKDALGWIPPDRRWEPAPGTEESATIVRSARPPEEGYLIAVVPRGPNSTFTAEVRQVMGHDRPLPGQAIVLHEVEGGRAYVVDVDANGDPNDDAAQWTAGETFTDSLSGFALRVDAEVADGFEVTITRGWRLDVTVSGKGSVRGGGGAMDCVDVCDQLFAARGTSVTLVAEAASGHVFGGWSGACAGGGTCDLTMRGPRAVGAAFLPARALTVTSVLQHLLGQPTTLTADDLAFLDQLGNRNGRFDIGDVLAWMIRTGVLNAAATVSDVVVSPLSGTVP
jgi:M6 family metalloprotease-like protein